MIRKIFICGGHVTPAIALIDELARDPTLAIIFIGRTSAAEYTLIRGAGIRFIPITTGKWHRTFTIAAIISLLQIPVGFVQALLYCIRERPAVVVSFGGYVALPVAIAAWMTGVPVLTHEQTLTAGLANSIIAKIAKRVCVSFQETLRHFPEGKAVYTGLPMRKVLFAPRKTSAYHIDQKYPLIYITGGSQGAKSLNDKIIPAIRQLTTRYTVIHQTGPQRIPKSLRYIPETYISVDKLSWILTHAMIVIGRSGANTTIECAALGRPAILVPLPWSAGNEQLLHARWLERHAGAVVMEQQNLTTDALMNEIQKIRDNYDTILARANQFSKTIPRDAAHTLAGEVYRLLQ